jgi:hypothetical protein
MLQIALALGTATPLGLSQRFRAAGSWATNLLHLGLAFAIAGCVYGLVMLAIVRIYPSEQPLAAWLYTAGLTLATLTATASGTLLAPARFARFTRLATGSLAPALPASIVLNNLAAGHWHAGGLLYLAVSIAAGILAMRLVPVTPHSPAQRFAC